jgi:tetratricopeptide (TPR) repeat protein
MLVRRCLAVLIALVASMSTAAQAQEVPGCGSLENAYGPFDYRDPASRHTKLPIVEAHHFTQEVETLRAGKSSYLIGDLDYTLRAFPNHPRALLAVSRFELQGGVFRPEYQPSADCYFQRALAFTEDDATVHLLYGNYLFKRKKLAEAKTHYEEALRLSPNSPEITYNAGLFFVDTGDLARAKELAKIAYDANYPLPGLQKKIASAEAAQTKR